MGKARGSSGGEAEPPWSQLPLPGGPPGGIPDWVLICTSGKVGHG